MQHDAQLYSMSWWMQSESIHNYSEHKTWGNILILPHLLH